MNRTELEARCSSYLDWIAKSSTERQKHFDDLGNSFAEVINGITKKQKLSLGLLKLQILKSNLKKKLYQE